MAQTVTIPIDEETKDDLVHVLAGITGIIHNERVRAYNEGVDTERARCAKLAQSYPDRWEEPESGARDIRKLTSAEIAHFILNHQLDE